MHKDTIHRTDSPSPQPGRSPLASQVAPTLALDQIPYKDSALSRALIGDRVPFKVNGKVSRHMLHLLHYHSIFARQDHAPEELAGSTLIKDFIELGGRPRAGGEKTWDYRGGVPIVNFASSYSAPSERPLDGQNLSLFREAVKVLPAGPDLQKLNLPVGAILVDIERAQPHSSSRMMKLLRRKEEAPLNIGITFYMPSHCSSTENGQRLDPRAFTVRLSMQIPGEQASKVFEDLKDREALQDTLLSLLTYPPEDGEQGSAVGDALKWLQEGALIPGAHATQKTLGHFLRENFVIGSTDDQSFLPRFRAALEQQV